MHSVTNAKAAVLILLRKSLYPCSAEGQSRIQQTILFEDSFGFSLGAAAAGKLEAAPGARRIRRTVIVTDPTDGAQTSREIIYNDRDKVPSCLTFLLAGQNTVSLVATQPQGSLDEHWQMEALFQHTRLWTQ